MAGACRKFCVMTTGRSGSSALMDALRPYEDIDLPGKQTGSRVSDELLLVRDLKQHLRTYEEMTGGPVPGPKALIETFYRLSAGRAFAGFKSMPHRHADYSAFVRRPDIQFITLVRGDQASTVASFMLAMRQGTWGRRGGPASERWSFQPEDASQARAILKRLRTNQRALEQVPGAIRVTYEDLCDASDRLAELDSFFGRPIRIAEPKPPTFGAVYTGNWDAFLAALGLEEERG